MGVQYDITKDDWSTTINGRFRTADIDTVAQAIDSIRGGNLAERRRQTGPGWTAADLPTFGTAFQRASQSLAGNGSAGGVLTGDGVARLRAAAASYAGTPYKWGGTTRQGMDCSAFVQHVYEDALGIRVPAPTGTQMNLGNAVSLAQSAPGDMVLFRTGASRSDRPGRHVGIILDNDQVVHCGKRGANSVDPFYRDGRTSYWNQRVLTIRRILQPSDLAVGIGPGGDTLPTGPSGPVSAADAVWMARCIVTEAGNPAHFPFVAWTIRNRKDTRYRSSVTGASTYQSVVLDPYQYSAFNGAGLNGRGSMRNPHGRAAIQMQANSTSSTFPHWADALRVATAVIGAPESQNIFARYTPRPNLVRHYYSPRAMSPSNSHPLWAYIGNNRRNGLRTHLPIPAVGTSFKFYHNIN